MTTKEQVERLDFWAVRNQWINSQTEIAWVRFSDYAALLARAEAAEAERDRQYDENVHRIMMEAAAHARGREEGLREALCCVPPHWNSGELARERILALIEKPDGG